MSTPSEGTESVKGVASLRLNPDPEFSSDATYMATLKELNEWVTALWLSIVGGNVFTEDKLTRLTDAIKAYHDAVRSQSSRNIFFARTELENLAETVFGKNDAGVWTLKEDLNVYASLIAELRDAENEVRSAGI